jgi:hypothetical protein
MHQVRSIACVARRASATFACVMAHIMNKNWEIFPRGSIIAPVSSILPQGK